MFLFSDSQIKLEGFVEDINALLNSGEVPNLFPYDERASVCEAVRPAAVRAGRPAESQADLWNFFVERTKANLHIVLCFSPIGDAFRCAPDSRSPRAARGCVHGCQDAASLSQRAASRMRVACPSTPRRRRRHCYDAAMFVAIPYCMPRSTSALVATFAWQALPAAQRSAVTHMCHSRVCGAL